MSRPVIACSMPHEPAYAGGYEVRISTTTTDVAGFLTNAPLFSITVEESTDWQPRVVDLAAAGYANQAVYIAFRNNSTDKFVLLIDHVVVQ